MMKKVPFIVSCLLCVAVYAQTQDPKKKTIDITSTFKPVLREASKINFNAAPPVADTTRPRLTYNIPVQNLLFAYQPADLKPVALHVDSLTAWEYSNYIKAGIGNVHQPFIQAGFSFGNTTNSYFNIFADHYTSKGDLPFQKNSLTNLGITGTVRTIENHEWNGRIGFKSEDYYFYGFQPATLNFTKEQLRQRFQTFEGKLHFRNYAPTEFGLLYNPNLAVSVFANSMEPRGQETNSVLTLPLEKRFGDTWGFKLGLVADLTGFKPGGNKNGSKTINNNIYMVTPALLFKTPNVYVHGGIIPSWDQRKFNLMPNIMVDFTVPDQPFTVQAGWIGYYDKGSYQRFAGINPWIAQPDSLRNTRVQEFYVGVKGSVNNHLTYNAKLGYNSYKNIALFVNDSDDGKTFLTIYDPSVHAFHLHSEVGYTQGEAFSASAKFDMNIYGEPERQLEAYGLLPLEFSASLKWRLMKDLWLRGDLFAWDGAQFRSKDMQSAFKGEGGIDLSAGLEFRITRQFNLWVQMNNIFNNRYQRWNQYEAYGFNILGGIVYSFGQKR